MTRSLSRPRTSSAWKWIAEGTESHGDPDPRTLADVERRKALGPRADLTGRLLGDPPPGRSALEQKLEAERRRAAAIEAMEEPEAVEERARAWSERDQG